MVNFHMIGEYSKFLEKIIIPSSVKSIRKNCFYYCSSINSISFDLPCYITSIQESTFEMCSSLTKINIPPSITSIDHFAFKNCSKLKRIRIYLKIEKIDVHAFEGSFLPETPTTIEFKIFIIGGSNTGKTCILKRYFDNIFEDCPPTIGADLYCKFMNINGYDVKFCFYDLPSREMMSTIRRYHYEDADYAVIVADFIEESSIDSFIYYKDLLECNGPIPSILLRNKCDSEFEKIDLVEKFNDFQKEHNLKSFDVSVKNNYNIKEAFQYMETEVFSMWKKNYTEK